MGRAAVVWAAGNGRTVPWVVTGVPACATWLLVRCGSVWVDVDVDVDMDMDVDMDDVDVRA